MNIKNKSVFYNQIYSNYMKQAPEFFNLVPVRLLEGFSNASPYKFHLWK